MKILRTKKIIKPKSLSEQDKKNIGDILLKNQETLKKEDKDNYKNYLQESKARADIAKAEKNRRIKDLEKQIEDLKNGQ